MRHAREVLQCAPQTPSYPRQQYAGQQTEIAIKMIPAPEALLHAHQMPSSPQHQFADQQLGIATQMRLAPEAQQIALLTNIYLHPQCAA